MRSPGATPSPSTTPTSAVEQGTEAASDIVTIDTTRTAVSEAGATPMAQRVAVLGLLNKRNGERRDITLKPTQAMREIGRAHVGTPTTNAQLVCRFLLKKKKTKPPPNTTLH